MEKWLKPFWDQYGNSLIMLLAHGILIAVLIEIGAKKLFNSMIEKAEGSKKEKLIRLKACASTISAVILTATSVFAVVKSMPLPGGAYFYAFWYCLVYVIQYLTSMYGLKRIRERWEESKKEKAAPKPKVKTVKVEESTHLFKRLEDGSFVEI